MCPEISKFRAERFEQGEILAVASPGDMERVDQALRAVLDL